MMLEFLCLKPTFDIWKDSCILLAYFPNFQIFYLVTNENKFKGLGKQFLSFSYKIALHCILLLNYLRDL